MIDLFVALLTPVIGFIAVYVAYQQWQTNRQRLRLDLYGRRLRIYQAVDKYIGVVTTDFDPKLEDYFEFREATAEAVFLFGSDIQEYLNDLSEHSLALRKLQQEYRHARTHDSTPPKYDSVKFAEDEHRHAVWFSKQHKAAIQRFGEYMKLFPRDTPSPVIKVR